MEFTLPQKLERGDKVAIIRPGNGPAKTEYSHIYELGLKRLKQNFDLRPVEFPTCDMTAEELTENPEKRAKDVMDAFRDPEIKGVIAAVGGSGEQVKILKHLDPEVLKQNPTRFYGFSDNTSLGLYLWKQGIMNFQGPMVMSELAMQGGMHDYTERYVDKAFFSDSLGRIEESEFFTDDSLDWEDPENLERTREEEENPGTEWYNASGEKITGRTWGGCLDVVSIDLQSGRPLPDPGRLQDRILVLETSEELPDSNFVDSFMTALGERGWLQKFSAVLVGRAMARSHVEQKNPEERREFREKQKQALKKNIDEYAPGTPVVFDLNFGHAHPIFPIPLGGKVEIDIGEKEVRVPLD